MPFIKIYRLTMVLFIAAALAGSIGCGKKPSKSEQELDAKLKAAVEQLQAKKKPYSGNLTPEKAAEITHEVSAKSMLVFPSGEALPKDPQELMKVNEKIQQETEKIYIKNGTTASDMMSFISEMSPKQRETYNNRLTELFLEQSKKKFASDKAQSEAAPTPVAAQATPAKPAK